MHSLPSIIRIIKLGWMGLAEHLGRICEKKNACRILGGEPEGRRPLESPRSRYVDDTKMVLGEIVCCGMD
jgi:hypothetical protein